MKNHPVTLKWTPTLSASFPTNLSTTSWAPTPYKSEIVTLKSESNGWSWKTMVVLNHMSTLSESIQCSFLKLQHKSHHCTFGTLWFCPWSTFQFSWHPIFGEGLVSCLWKTYAHENLPWSTACCRLLNVSSSAMCCCSLRHTRFAIKWLTNLLKRGDTSSSSLKGWLCEIGPHVLDNML